MADLATDQTITYNAIPTNIGLTKIQLAMTTGVDLILSTLAYGDGGGSTPIPSPDQTSLVNQIGSTDILGHEEDLQDNVTWYSGIIKAGDASGTLREIGLFDEDGELCFVGNIPDITLPESIEGVAINLPIQLGIKNYYSKYISIKTHIKVIEQVEGSGGYSLFDLVQKDHILGYDETEGFALQGTWVHKQALDQEYYGYPDFIQKCIEEKNQLGTVIKRIQLGENTITGYVNLNGHIFYDVDSDKAAVDAYFEQTGVAWFWGIDENGEDGTGNDPRVFLPRNNYFFKNSFMEPGSFRPNLAQDFDPGKYNSATLPSLAHNHNITMEAAGGHTHTVTIGSAGSHSHTLTIYSAGSHSHTKGNMRIRGTGPFWYSGNSADAQTQVTGAFYIDTSTKFKGVANASTSKNDPRLGFDTDVNTRGVTSWTGSTSSNGSHSHEYYMGTSGNHIHDISLATNGSHTHVGTADNKEIVSSNLLGDTVSPPSVNLLLYIVVGNVRRRAAIVIDQKLEEALEEIQEAADEAVARVDAAITPALETIDQAVNDAKEEINTVAAEVEQEVQGKVDEAEQFAEISREQAEISEYWANISIAGQVQADWTEEDPTKVDYIKNKPNVDWSNIVYLNSEQTLTNKTINAENNNIENIGFDNLAQGVVITVLGDESVSQTTLATSQAIWNAIKNINILFSNLDSGLILTTLTNESVSQTTLATSQAIWNAIYSLPTSRMGVITSIKDAGSVSNDTLPTSLAVYTAILEATNNMGIDIVGGEGVFINTEMATTTNIQTSREELVVTSSYTGTQPQVGTLTYIFTYKDSYSKLQTTTETTSSNPNLIVTSYYTGTQPEVGIISHTFTYVSNEYGNYWTENDQEVDLSQYNLVITGSPQEGDVVTLIYTTSLVNVPAHWEDASGTAISLANYDLTITSGTPQEGDTITLTYITTSTITISIDVAAIAALVNYNDLKGKPNYTFQEGLTSHTSLRTITKVECNSSSLVVTSSYTGTQPEVGVIEYQFAYIEISEEVYDWQDVYSGETVNLADYDLVVAGEPEEGDTITLTYTTENTTVVTTDFEFINGLTTSTGLQTQTEVSVSNVDLIVNSSYTGTQPEVGIISHTFTYVLENTVLNTITSVESSSNIQVESSYIGPQSSEGTIVQHFLYSKESSLVTNTNIVCSNPDLTVISTFVGHKDTSGTLTYDFTYRSYEWSGETRYAWFLNDSIRIDDIETEYDLQITGTPQEDDTITLTYITTEQVTYEGWILVEDNEKVNLTDYDLTIISGTPQENDYITVTYVTTATNVYNWEENSQVIDLADYDLTITSGTPQEGDTIGLIYITTLGKITVSLDDTINSQTQPVDNSSTAVATTAFVRNLQTYQPLGSFDNGNIVLQDGISVYAASANISAATTFTFSTSNLTYLSNSVYYTFEVKFTMNTVSTLTFPANLTWQNGEAPTFEEAGTYLLAFRTMDAGTTFIGNLQGKW